MAANPSEAPHELTPLPGPASSSEPVPIGRHRASVSGGPAPAEVVTPASAGGAPGAVPNGNEPLAPPARPVGPPMPPAMAPQRPPVRPAAPPPTSMSPPAPMTPPAGQTSARGDSGGSGTFRVALALATLVAVGGVAFGIGRWSAEDPNSPLTRATGAQSAAGALAGNQSFGGGRGSRGAAGGLEAGNDAQLPPGGEEAPLGEDASVTSAGAAAGTVDAEQDVAQQPGVGSAAEPGPGGRAGGGGFGGGGSLGRGGIQGTVEAMTDGSLTIVDADGQATTIMTGPETSFVRESSATTADLADGDLVRVQLPFAARGGADDGATQGSDTAATITVLAPGTAPGAGFGTGGPGQAAADGAGAAGLREGAQRGFGGRGLTVGSVLGVADGGVMLTLADGQTQLVSTDAATSVVRQELTDRSALSVGDEVRVQLPRGGFGQGAAADPAADAVATLVTIIDAGPPTDAIELPEP